MNKYILFFSLITILIIGFSLAYFFYEKPSVENSKETAYLSFLVLSGEEQIETDYFIFVNGQDLHSGKTVKNGYLIEEVPFNSSITLFIEKEGFYPEIISILTESEKNIRRDVKLSQIGSVNFSSDSSIRSDFFYFNITKIGEVRNPFLCLRWSTSIVYAKMLNLTTNSEKIDRIFYDRCYDFPEFENTTEFSMQIIKMREINEHDFIKFYVIDRDFTSENLYEIKHSKQINATEIDLFMKDAEFIINK